MSFPLENIGNVFTILSGYPFDSSFFNEDRNGLPLIRVRDVNTAIAGVYYSGKYDEEYVVSDGDLLISLDGDFNCVEWKGGRSLLNQRVCKLIPIDGIVSKDYALHFLPAELQKIHRNTNFTTVKHLSVRTIGNIKIPLPPIREQIQIATVLNKSKELIETREENLDLIDRFLMNTFLKKYSENLNSSKSYILDELKSGNGGTFSNGPFGSDLLTSELTTEGTPVIYIRDIRSGTYEWKSDVFVTKEKADSLPNCTVMENDLLIAKVGDPPGISAVYPLGLPQAIITQDVIRIRLNEGLANPQWMRFLINSVVGQRLIKQITITGTRSRFSLSEFKRLNVSVPSIDVQRVFAEIVEKTETLKSQFKNSLNDLESLYGSLSQRAFKGELDLSAINIDESLLRKAEHAKKESSPTIQIQEALHAAASIVKHFEKVNDLSKAVNRFNIYFDSWRKLNVQLKALPKLPESIIKAQENVARIQKAFSSVVPAAIPKTRGKLTWDNVSSEQIANLIKEYYAGFHFTSEMVTRFLTEEHVIIPKYYSSEELKKNPKANDADDFKTFLFAALNNENPFLKLEQVFYNAEADNVKLTLRNEDFELIKEREKSDRTGIYLRVVE